MTDRTYTVHTCDHGVWIVGSYAPCDDVSGLLRTWAYRGLRLTSLAVAKRLGALVAVVESTLEETEWLAELEDRPSA